LRVQFLGVLFSLSSESSTSFWNLNKKLLWYTEVSFVVPCGSEIWFLTLRKGIDWEHLKTEFAGEYF
jgi:hypothetical protein